MFEEVTEVLTKDLTEKSISVKKQKLPKCSTFQLVYAIFKTFFEFLNVFVSANIDRVEERKSLKQIAIWYIFTAKSKVIE